MEIQWIGGSSFIIKNSIGKRILIDPVQLISTIKKYDFKSNIITFSHTHNHKNILDFVDNECKIINSVCSFENDFLSLNGFLSYRDNMNGTKRGENIIYIFEIDGLKLCHLGALGHKLDEDLLKTLTDIDILFIPIGGHFYLDGYTASKLALSIGPKYIIPMCYRTCNEYFFLDGPHKFLSNMKNVIKYKSTILKTDELNFENKNTVILLPFSN
ncbi:MBL fold metallo-hydrolase [Clostridium carnis]